MGPWYIIITRLQPGMASLPLRLLQACGLQGGYDVALLSTQRNSTNTVEEHYLRLHNRQN